MESAFYGNKNALYRANKSLRELFNMQDKGLCVTTKNREIFTKVHITYYNNNNSLVEANHNILLMIYLKISFDEIPSNDDYEDVIIRL